jgi:hypothetical protein
MAPFTEEGSVNKHQAAVMNHNCIILGMEYYSSGRAPDKQVQVPEFKPHYCNQKLNVLQSVQW